MLEPRHLRAQPTAGHAISLLSLQSRLFSGGEAPPPAHVLTALTTRLSPIIRGKRLPEGGRKACLRPVFLGSPSCVAGRLPVENVVRRQICILLPVEIKKKKKSETSAGRRQGPCRCSVGPTLLVGARLGFSARESCLCVPYLSFHS